MKIAKIFFPRANWRTDHRKKKKKRYFSSLIMKEKKRKEKSNWVKTMYDSIYIL
jgi:hypothetical protein